jgi:16S rRNA (guanine966-N2)-methyltransferase
LDLRPTSDRLKETLFNILNPVIPGSIFLDVFAGTGAIGLEAISRGACEAVFIEEGRAGCSLIRQNLRLCGIMSG